MPVPDHTSGFGRYQNAITKKFEIERTTQKEMTYLSHIIRISRLLEKLADGRTNWDFGTNSTEEAAPSGDDGGVSASIGKASLKNASRFSSRSVAWKRSRGMSLLLHNPHAA